MGNVSFACVFLHHASICALPKHRKEVAFHLRPNPRAQLHYKTQMSNSLEEYIVLREWSCSFLYIREAGRNIYNSLLEFKWTIKTHFWNPTFFSWNVPIRNFQMIIDVPLALTETSAGEKPLQMDKWVKGPLVEHVTSTSGPRLGFHNSAKLAFGILKSAPGMEGKLRKMLSTRTIFGFHNWVLRSKGDLYNCVTLSDRECKERLLCNKIENLLIKYVLCG